MKYVERVRNHPLYQAAYAEIVAAEKERIFCKHDFSHFLDVARIAYIFNLEENLAIDKETIYLVALLHDIGRAKQYQEGIPHEVASAQLAAKILKDVAVDEASAKRILEAISSHRNSGISLEKNLKGILYRADKKSRACFACPVQNQCNWSADKKNRELEV